MSLTTHLGYGPFQLRDFRAGEAFARFDGSLARVCDPQPVERPGYIQIWNSCDTSNAERVWLHASALAYAVTEEMARRIERLRKGGVDP